MPSDKFRQKNPKNKQTKFQLVFDDTSRNDFLTGFQKRKKARKKIAQQEVEEKRKEDRRKERQKRRDALEEELKSIRLPEPDTESKKKKQNVIIDHPQHTVTVTTSLDLRKEHGGIGENQVDYDEDEDDEGEEGEDHLNGENGDDEDVEEDAVGRLSLPQDDDEEEESEDEETSKLREAKNKKKEIFTKRRQKMKKQLMKKKRGASQQTVRKMKSMKRKSLGKFVKRGSARKAKR